MFSFKTLLALLYHASLSFVLYSCTHSRLPVFFQINKVAERQGITAIAQSHIAAACLFAAMSTDQGTYPLPLFGPTLLFLNTFFNLSAFVLPFIYGYLFRHAAASGAAVLHWQHRFRQGQLRGVYVLLG